MTDPHASEPAHEPEIRYHVPINQWAEADRPREKLIKRGPAALSDAELIALIFGSGTRTKAYEDGIEEGRSVSLRRPVRGSAANFGGYLEDSNL